MTLRDLIHPFFLVYETHAFIRAALGGRPGTEALGDCCSLVSLLESRYSEGGDGFGIAWKSFFVGDTHSLNVRCS